MKNTERFLSNPYRLFFNELTYLKKLNVTLQQMRDRLLPQLMSGQLEVTP